MKHLKSLFLVACGLMVLLAATLAPIAAEASCPDVTVRCGNSIRSCSGTDNGTSCSYKKSCLTCARVE